MIIIFFHNACLGVKRKKKQVIGVSKNRNMPITLSQEQKFYFHFLKCPPFGRNKITLYNMTKM
jgi:hypothetical protein